ncbi:hypothetical protein T265_02515 [Opisthorchis viverrini]|uniref:Uncharacterized protein n=1 Tax=Opisthorchis viverrini TaxID=6198 RepID=A0A075A6F4_OPIVI|nr:hypothetical protein T265_02515 [Opisthorchis viverrini]KER31190.1 hypothetical protein T265_02515 [Opisthorchis viverrini]
MEMWRISICEIAILPLTIYLVSNGNIYVVTGNSPSTSSTKLLTQTTNLTLKSLVLIQPLTLLFGESTTTKITPTNANFSENTNTTASKPLQAPHHIRQNQVATALPVK